ncbi:hypothetical protein ACF087_16605 [Streptomyces goshikiensis]|uniref:hypothetical protein n=1 Tax=Streptomyces goshikiensis TaxID=1942 RepID=UPI0036FFB278
MEPKGALLVMYGCFTAGRPEPEGIARVLAAAFGVPLLSVDVSLESEMENRKGDASVTCDYEYLSGDLACNLSVYGAKEVVPQPSEEELTRALARGLDTVVLISRGTTPSIRKVVTPQGGTTFAGFRSADRRQEHSGLPRPGRG